MLRALPTDSFVKVAGPKSGREPTGGFAAARTQSRTLGALVALPGYGHSFIGSRSPCGAIGMTRIGTKPLFVDLPPDGGFR